MSAPIPSIHVLALTMPPVYVDHISPVKDFYMHIEGEMSLLAAQNAVKFEEHSAGLSRVT